MRLRLRFLWLIMASFFKSRLSLLEESVLSLRVLPNDVDVTKITNDRYCALMDLGRLDLAFRFGLRDAMVRYGWIPVATYVTIRFRYPLKMFQKYELHTRIVWWNDSTFFWEQNFIRNGRIVATGHVCATVINKHGIVPSKAILDVIAPDIDRPERPEIVSQLIAAEALIRENQKQAEPSAASA